MNFGPTKLKLLSFEVSAVDICLQSFFIEIRQKQADFNLTLSFATQMVIYTLN